MEDTIVEILEILIKCRTNRDEVKTVILTDFISPQKVTLERETVEEKTKYNSCMKNKKFILTIEEDENE